MLQKQYERIIGRINAEIDRLDIINDPAARDWLAGYEASKNTIGYYYNNVYKDIQPVGEELLQILGGLSAIYCGLSNQKKEFYQAVGSTKSIVMAEYDTHREKEKKYRELPKIDDTSKKDREYGE